MTQPSGKSSTRTSAVLAWLRIARVFQKIDAHSAHLFQQYGLTTAQFDVLAKLGAAEGMSQQELAASLLVTKGNVSQVLERMEQRGLIIRRQEGRSKFLFLTEQGRALFISAVPDQERHVGELFATLSAGEQTQLLHLLRKLDHGIDT